MDWELRLSIPIKKLSHNVLKKEAIKQKRSLENFISEILEEKACEFLK